MLRVSVGCSIKASVMHMQYATPCQLTDDCFVRLCCGPCKHCVLSSCQRCPPVGAQSTCGVQPHRFLDAGVHVGQLGQVIVLWRPGLWAGRCGQQPCSLKLCSQGSLQPQAAGQAAGGKTPAYVTTRRLRSEEPAACTSSTCAEDAASPAMGARVLGSAGGRRHRNDS